ncbi:fibrinogen-like protein 1-like protein [Cyrtonyx montezumae]|uniref:fibrinogen-like protein 1-like protein n=1 Tax=Cyrtonyx montezumae TaxID=9017 RepID=UPI0032DACD79
MGQTHSAHPLQRAPQVPLPLQPHDCACQKEPRAAAMATQYLLILACVLILAAAGLSMPAQALNRFKKTFSNTLTNTPKKNSKKHSMGIAVLAPTPLPFLGLGLLRALSVSLHQVRCNTHLFPAPGWPKEGSEIPPGSPSGVYVIQPSGLHPIVVHCEMNVTDGGWTVIQRNRYNTDITWAESWSTYKYGFGNVHGDYWLGTEYVHQITKQKVYQVRFIIHDASNNTKFAEYNLFSLDNESQGYRLRLGTYAGAAGDAMGSDNPSNVHNNLKFSTKDWNQDTSRRNCASRSGGGWWYSVCYSVRLNFKGGMT